MESLAGPEKIIALIGAIVVFVFAVIGLRGEWHKTGLDDQVTKLLLGLMAFGCILVVLAATGILPHTGGGAA
jgi:NADH:ubiquinone oxidoreductase subunit 6 (subunit J)